MHEGRDDTPGLFMLGERPVNQVLPAARWLAEHRDVRRWAVVGNDYVFPRVSGRAVRESLRGTGSSVVRETYVPLGTSDFRSVLAGLEAGHGGGQGGVDGVLMLLMGQDAVHFNRQFAAAGLGGVLTRLSPAVEENTLLGAGAGAHDDLWAAAAYFEGMDTVESGDLAERYARRFGSGRRRSTWWGSPATRRCSSWRGCTARPAACGSRTRRGCRRAGSTVARAGWCGCAATWPTRTSTWRRPTACSSG
ncbi:ABC transporter substrate-binding protein [Nocardioides daphniae]|uniref:ABC transporter substrate-binding protein n=1 Tax=Nocardioides daphniae TaxID=402297 RepID=UPI0023B09E24|nr:ABC transporter substrate-binding protein [Nocardioides daphniae]